MEYLMTSDGPTISASFRRYAGPQINASQSDIRPMARGELKILQRDLRFAIARTSDRMSKLHLEDALERVNTILDPK
jgi:hypothetical protein